MADLVYHYTDGPGLRGIVEKHALWATDLRYMNDESELNYAVALLDEAFTEGLALLPDGPTKDWIAGLRTQLERFETIAVFAVCFCQDGDLLSMWRAYAPRTGYSIGFEPSSLNAVEMIYEPAAQRHAIIELIQRFHANVDVDFAGISANPLRREGAELELLSAIATRLVRIKHGAFSEEQEWRRPKFLSLRRDPIDKIKFRDGGNLGFRPYLELDWSELAGSAAALPIKEVFIGPTMHPALAERGLRLLLDQNGYKGVQIRRSKIPLRAAPLGAG
jgi:hypothetical protein